MFKDQSGLNPSMKNTPKKYENCIYVTLDQFAW